MTVERMEREMSSAEFTEWVEFYRLEGEEVRRRK
ncbi:MAG: hypothetical protein JWM27_4735 [Gemmatimonadetes bacterium]|nr:hypothetical protein [Gemmatimonadota bacterium]